MENIAFIYRDLPVVLEKKVDDFCRECMLIFGRCCPVIAPAGECSKIVVSPKLLVALLGSLCSCRVFVFIYFI